MKLPRGAQRVLGLLVLVGFGWAVNHYWGFDTLFQPWAKVPVLLVAIVVVAQMASYSLRAYRVYRAEPEIPRGSWPQCLRLILLNNISNLLLPARTGEASFPLLLNRWFGVNAAKGTGTLIWLRLLDLSVLAVLAVAVLGSAFLPVAAVAIVCVVGVIAPMLMVPIHARVGTARTGLIGKVLSGVPARAGQVVFDLVLTWSAWAIKLGALAVVFAQLAGLSLPIALLGAIGGDLSTVLPVHAPGGFGTYEAGVIGLVAPAHHVTKELVAAAVNLHLLVLGIALAAGAGAWLAQPKRVVE